jgi:hypothetical protein
VHRGWLVLRSDTEPYGCLDDPMLDQSRYLDVDAGTPVLLSLANGRQDWSRAISDGTVVVSGDPVLAGDLPRWFRPADAAARAPRAQLPSPTPTAP